VSYHAVPAHRVAGRGGALVSRLSCAALVLAVTLPSTAACGKSEQEKQAEAAAAEVKAAAKKFDEAAKKAQAESSDVAKGLEAMAQGLAGAASAVGGNGEPVTPVSFKQLQSVFPTLPGWTRGKPTGEQMTSPVAYSQSEIRYTKGDGRIELKIIDSGFHQLLLAPYTVFLTAGYERQTENGYEKSTKVGAEPGWEKWNAAANTGEVNAVVAKRFLVQAEGHKVEDIKILHDVLGKIDFVRLGKLK
jgi:hypothetical protein